MPQKTFCFGLIVASFLALTEESVSQIPSNGSDFPFLETVRWGMTLREARDSLVRYNPTLSTRRVRKFAIDQSRGANAGEKEGTILSYSDTTLVYSESLFNENVEVTLSFTKDLRLRSVSVTANKASDALLNQVLKTLESRHGSPTSYQKKEERKFFFSFLLEGRHWKTESGLILLSNLFKDGTVAMLMVVYTPTIPQ